MSGGGRSRQHAAVLALAARHGQISAVSLRDAPEQTQAWQRALRLMTDSSSDTT